MTTNPSNYHNQTAKTTVACFVFSSWNLCASREDNHRSLRNFKASFVFRSWNLCASREDNHRSLRNFKASFVFRSLMIIFADSFKNR